LNLGEKLPFMAIEEIAAESPGISDGCVREMQQAFTEGAML